MNRVDYQNVRFSVENQIANYDAGICDSGALANSLMRLFLQALSTEQVKRQTLKRDFLTFRRNPDLIPPSWAYRNPGLSSRIPTL